MNCIDGLQVFFVIILIVVFIIGNIGNGFIALVNIMDCVKRREISLVDRILTALAICRITFLICLVFSIMAFVFHTNLWMDVNILRMINITSIVTNHFNVWLTCCLSVFYFLKIAHFSNSIFLYLKWRIKKVVLMIMLGSLLLMLLNMILTNVGEDAHEDGLQKNMSYSSNWSLSSQLLNSFVSTNYILICIPFALSMLIFLLLAFSLWKHLKKVQENARDVSTRTHTQALKIVFAWLLLYIMIFLSIFLHLATDQFLDGQLIMLSSVALGMTFTSLHSWALILFGNSKLRQALLLLLSWLKCRSEVVESMGP